MSQTIEVRSPYNDRVVGTVDKCSENDVKRAVEDAVRALEANRLPAWQRAEILSSCSNALKKRSEDFARIITEESAKPISIARTEVARAVSTMSLSGIEACNTSGEMVPMEGTAAGAGHLGFTRRVPVGVVGAISPFNFPLNLVCHKVGPAIAAGCPVVLKPASTTPLSAFALCELLIECGLPREWFSVVAGPGAEVGNALVEHPGIAYISFTGSAEVGWDLVQKAPRKKVRLELGNSTPVIIEADSDWRAAAKAVAAGGYNHAGQSCISAQRIYVQNDIAAQFIDELVSNVRALDCGDPFDDEVTVSALITRDDCNRVHSWVTEAQHHGATLLCGNEIDGSILTPVVLSNATVDMKVCSEEVFGPVVSVQSYDTTKDAISLANGTRYGLQAGIYTSNIDTAMAAAQGLDFGGVTINEIPTWRADVMPYGGSKDSGNTREGPRYAVREMTEERLTVIKL